MLQPEFSFGHLELVGEEEIFLIEIEWCETTECYLFFFFTDVSINLLI